MNLIHVSYTSIFHFLVVSKHMNMSKAADELYISQAALSQSIAKLENSLGVPLFFREKKKLILTPEAEMLMPFFEDFRKSHDNLVSEVEMLHERSAQNVINIGCVGSAYTFTALYFSEILADSALGDVRLSFLTEKMALNLLLAGQMDFILSKVNISHPLVASQFLTQDSIGVAMPLHHSRLKKQMLEPSDLEKLSFHGLAVSHSFRQVCDEICRALDITIQYVTEDHYQMYNNRLFHSSGQEDICFFITRKNFQINLASLNKYVFLPINNELFSVNTCIYYIHSQRKHLQYADLIRRIQEIASGFEETNSHLNNILHKEHIQRS